MSHDSLGLFLSLATKELQLGTSLLVFHRNDQGRVIEFVCKWLSQSGKINKVAGCALYMCFKLMMKKFSIGQFKSCVLQLCAKKNKIFCRVLAKFPV